MKNLKNTLIISSYLLLVALFFSGGYAIGKISTEKTAEPMPLETPEAVETSVTEQKRFPEYEVKIEEGVLKIYKCIGEKKEVVTSEEISVDVFPREDIEELGRGVRFERLEQAQYLFENFVS